MNPTNINQILWSNLIAVSGIDDLCLLIGNTVKEQKTADVLDMLDVLVGVDLQNDKAEKIADTLEAAYIDGAETDLAPYLAVLFQKIGVDHLARYYAGLVANVPDSLAETFASINGASVAERLPCSAYSIEKHEFSKKYFHNGEEKEYSIHSFSDAIGKNATVLKTPYGAIMFDCGAACGVDSTDVITEIELLEFFMRIDISPDDLIAVVISHAHLDHYGSITTLINLGIGFEKIYIEDDTKALIQQVANGIPSLANAMPINAFFVPFQRVKISAFSNGHILGSTGYVVTFDDRNVVYTGDYCIHSQQTVDGLNIDKLRRHKEIASHGVDCLITETTYGRRAAPIAYEDVSKVFIHFVDLLIAHGYKVFIPSFAIGRSQEIALLLNETHSVLIDGLAAKISRIYENVAGIKVFNGNTRYNDSFDDNKEDNFDVNDIIIASSGMLSQNSTSYNYVKSFLESDRKIAIIKTGYISSESYGNELLNAWRGRNNRLFDISLSAHADFNEIYSLIEALNPHNIVCIHGDGLKDCLALQEAPAEDVDASLKGSTAIESKKVEPEETTVQNDTATSDNSEESADEKEVHVTLDAVNPQVLLEVSQEPNDKIVALIQAHLDAYLATPRGYRANGPSSRNEALYNTYNDLYSHVRLSPRYSNFYSDLFNIGPKKTRSYTYLWRLNKALAGESEADESLIEQEEDTAQEKTIAPAEDNIPTPPPTPVPIAKPEPIASIPVEEEPQWSEDSILYVHKGTIICQRDRHNVVSATAVLLGRFEKNIELTVNYCKDCKRFFINYVSYETYKHRYGVLIGNIVMEDEGKTVFGDVVLAEASPLKLCGYSVNQQDGYTSQMRQYIISKIIDRGIMSKSDVVRYLEYFISINGRQKRNQLAVSKWNEDLTFTLGYQAKKQERHYITEIKRYR